MAAFLCGALLLLSSCASTRKISQVGLRKPSSIMDDPEVQAIDGPRARLAAVDLVTLTCREKRSLAEQLRFLAPQRVRTLVCPDNLPTLVQTLSGAGVFHGEERSFLESMVNANCRGISRGGSPLEAQLQSFVEEFESDGPLARFRAKTGEVNLDTSIASNLQALKMALENLVTGNLSLERWLELHGDFLISIPAVDLFQQILEAPDCTLSYEQFDPVYRETQNIETLLGMLPGGDQKDRTRALVDSLYALLDKKIPDFFSTQSRRRP